MFINSAVHLFLPIPTGDVYDEQVNKQSVKTMFTFRLIYLQHNACPFHSTLIEFVTLRKNGFVLILDLGTCLICPLGQFTGPRENGFSVDVY